MGKMAGTGFSTDASGLVLRPGRLRDTRALYLMGTVSRVFYTPSIRTIINKLCAAYVSRKIILPLTHK
jgi:hypothetical protein